MTLLRKSAKRRGAGTDAGKEAVFVNGKWKAIPFSNIGQLMNWRTDWFAEVGVTNVSRHLGRALTRSERSSRRKDHPFGFELGTASVTTMAGYTRYSGPTAVREVADRRKDSV